MFRYSKILSIFLLLLTVQNLFAWNPDEYCVCVFNRLKKVNGLDRYNVIIGDGDGMDNHNYQGCEEQLNWVDAPAINDESEYSGPYTYASVYCQNKALLTDPWSGEIVLPFRLECIADPGEHEHSVAEINYHILCLWDETGNDPGDTLESLTPQHSWPPSYTHGVLWYTNWHGFSYHDVDTWKLDNIEPNKTYCIEFKQDSLLQGKIKVELFNGSTLVKTIDTTNMFTSTGSVDLLTRRLYFSLKNPIFPTVSITFKENHKNTSYSLALMKCKPVVLIHGLNGHPSKQSDKKSDFGSLKNFIGYLNYVRPCICLDFVWTTANGSYKDYVGKKSNPKTILGYLSESNQFFFSKATIMTYSMGGTILYDQMQNGFLANEMDNAVIICAPFWGVSVANAFYLNKIPYTELYQIIEGAVGISPLNLHDISRGSKINWQRNKNITFWNEWDKITLVIGHGNRVTKRMAVWFANNFGDDVNELADSEKSDGLIFFFSSNLQNRHPGIIIIESELSHDAISHFELNNIHERSDFFTDFVKKINNWNERAAVGL